MDEATALMHYRLGFTDPVDPTVRPCYDLRFLVIGATRFVEACVTRVDPVAVTSGPSRPEMTVPRIKSV